MTLQLPSPLGKSKTKAKRTPATKRKTTSRPAAPRRAKAAAPKKPTSVKRPPTKKTIKKAAPRKGAKRSASRRKRKIFALRALRAPNIKKARKMWGKLTKMARQHFRQYAAVWVIAVPLLWFIGPPLLGSGARLVGGMLSSARFSFGGIAPLFTPEVHYWSGNISRWAQQYNLDSNLLATVMQIESCGHPNVSSSAGAQGLFQVMPTYFTSVENQLDPNTNAMRGADVLNSCLVAANGDVGRALACYNGGQSVINRDTSTWSEQTQRYYYWGTGIYADAQRGSSSSDTLNRWLNAGGASLCQQASVSLGLSNTTH